MPAPLVSTRALAYSAALAGFFALGWVVYHDDPETNPAAFAELSLVGREGLAHWRSQNCNACHQLYGFGGYLGPDLTHVTARVTRADFESILRTGVGPMPRIELDERGVEALYEFLGEMGRTGQGHSPAGGQGPTWDEVLAALGPSAGADLFKARGCGECHAPMRLGRLASPDLSRALNRSGVDNVEDTIRRGRRNMPPYSSLSAGEITSLIDLMRALGERRSSLLPRLNSPPPPWFNYERGANRAGGSP